MRFKCVLSVLVLLVGTSVASAANDAWFELLGSTGDVVLDQQGGPGVALHFTSNSMTEIATVEIGFFAEESMGWGGLASFAVDLVGDPFQPLEEFFLPN